MSVKFQEKRRGEEEETQKHVGDEIKRRCLPKDYIGTTKAPSLLGCSSLSTFVRQVRFRYSLLGSTKSPLPLREKSPREGQPDASCYL